jgi:hypothetical protein
MHRTSAKDDQKICMMVMNKLAARGIRAPCSVSVTARNGEVTLTGVVVQAHQKSSAVHVASGIEGVKRVYDQMVVKAAAKRSDDASGQWSIKPLKNEVIADAPLADAIAVEPAPLTAETTSGEGAAT